MGQAKSRPQYGPCQRRLKQVHVLYRYGGRANTLKDIIRFLQTEVTLDRRQIQHVIRELHSLKRGVRDDLKLLGRGGDRQFEKTLLNVIEYLQFEPDLPKAQTMALVKQLKALQKAWKDDFETMHTMFYDT